jgi:uncharacterized protein YbaR (Trm112 family)
MPETMNAILVPGCRQPGTLNQLELQALSESKEQSALLYSETCFISPCIRAEIPILLATGIRRENHYFCGGACEEGSAAAESAGSDSEFVRSGLAYFDPTCPRFALRDALRWRLDRNQDWFAYC